MDRILLAAIFLIIGIFPALALAEGGKFEIRGLHWGDSEPDIRRKETGTLMREANQGAVKLLAYRGPFLGEDVSLLYRLIDGKLFQVLYTFESKGRTCKELLLRFEESRNALQTEYGPARETPSDDSDRCNRAVTWTPAETQVIAQLSTKSGRTDLQLAFESTKLSELGTSVSFPKPVASASGQK